MKYDKLILMSTIERMTITLTAEMAQAVRTAVQAGPSSSEIVREALRDTGGISATCRHRSSIELRGKVREGLVDTEEGRVQDFDPEPILRKGKQQLQKPESSA